MLFLDEPTTGVDPVSRKEFWEMLKRLQQKNITILVSTPYMDEAALCDRIALIQDGKILEIDTPEAIVKHYLKQIYALDFITDITLTPSIIQEAKNQIAGKVFLELHIDPNLYNKKSEKKLYDLLARVQKIKIFGIILPNHSWFT